MSIPARVMLKHVYDRREGGPVADASSDVTTNEINVTREGQSDLENIQQALECLLRKIDALEERLDATQGPRPLLTRQDVADYLQVSLRYVDGLIAERKIVPIRIGRVCRFHPDAVDAFVRNAAVGVRQGRAA